MRWSRGRLEFPVSVAEVRVCEGTGWAVAVPFVVFWLCEGVVCDWDWRVEGLPAGARVVVGAEAVVVGGGVDMPFGALASLGEAMVSRVSARALVVQAKSWSRAGEMV